METDELILPILLFSNFAVNSETLIISHVAIA